MKITIEVNVPDEVDLDHAYQSVTDAMYLPQNVTQLEYTMVANILNQLASKKANVILPKGFRDWAETHHEIVCTIYTMIDNDTYPFHLQKTIDKRSFVCLYDLGIDLTNEFCNTYDNKEWDGDWIDTIIDFVNKKLQ
jgi:hypothetical protein